MKEINRFYINDGIEDIVFLPGPYVSPSALLLPHLSYILFFALFFKNLLFIAILLSSLPMSLTPLNYLYVWLACLACLNIFLPYHYL